ncbi:MAG: TonB-dependent receptor [Chitinophagaceae bacterium]
MKKNLLVALFLASSSFTFSQNNQKVENSKGISSVGQDTTKSKLMEAIEIRAVRAEKNYPFIQNLITKRNIEKNNLGQDIPFLLNQIPGAVVNSDAGNGIGYTGIRIRGTDASRINFTLNGIAYNDAESQGVFLVNLPDFLSSTNSIQVQRGVGTSANGPGAFGASINLMTNEVQEKAYATLSNSIGSFNSLKNTIKTGTGLINGRYSIDARLSNISSDGYIDRSASKLQSFYVSAASIKEKSSLRLNVFSGKEKTEQAWYGITEEQLSANRKFNSAGTEKPGTPYDNETDNYTQTHYQLFYNKKLNTEWNFNAAVFATTGNGYYEQYKAQQSYATFGLPNFQLGGNVLFETDLIRQLWLDNLYRGTNFSFQKKYKNNEIIIGGGSSIYDGNHFGKIIWAQAGIDKDFKWYDLDARKQEQHLFGKWLHKYNDFHFFGDIQARNVSYNIEGFRNNPGLKVDQKWLFINPKIGIRYSKNNNSVFASYAIANKEPNRDDFEASTTEIPKHETLNDLELGFERNTKKLRLAVTAYYMHYRNQLVLTGKINDVGAYTRTNIPVSFRAGIEIESNFIINDKLQFNNNIALSRNKVKQFTEYYDDYDAGGQKTNFYSDADIAFSPAVVENATLSYKPFANTEIRLNSKYVSRQYLDNTSRKDRSIDPFFIQDLILNHVFKPKGFSSIELILQINNLWNKLYAPNGYTFSYTFNNQVSINNYYYPMAERNLMVGLNINF